MGDPQPTGPGTHELRASRQLCLRTPRDRSGPAFPSGNRGLVQQGATETVAFRHEWPASAGHCDMGGFCDACLESLRKSVERFRNDRVGQSSDFTWSQLGQSERVPKRWDFAKPTTHTQSQRSRLTKTGNSIVGVDYPPVDETGGAPMHRLSCRPDNHESAKYGPESAAGERAAAVCGSSNRGQGSGSGEFLYQAD